MQARLREMPIKREKLHNNSLHPGTLIEGSIAVGPGYESFFGLLGASRNPRAGELAAVMPWRKS